MKPSDFCVKPWDSVTQNSESETIAANIMVILKRTGNTWRDLSYDEYKKERLKDGEFSDREQPYFEKVINHCKSPETARLFSPNWDKIYNSL